MIWRRVAVLSVRILIAWLTRPPSLGKLIEAESEKFRASLRETDRWRKILDEHEAGCWRCRRGWRCPKRAAIADEGYFASMRVLGVAPRRPYPSEL